MELTCKLNSPEDLVTTLSQTRAGFIEAALEKNRKAQPYIEDARTLKNLASAAKNPYELLNISSIQKGLLTASGLSDKSLNYFTEADKQEAIKKLIEEFLAPAGDDFIDELVYRYLLIRGDSLGGSMRNLIGAIAKTKLVRKLLSVLSMERIEFFIQKKDDRSTNKWQLLDYETAYSVADEIYAVFWRYDGDDKVICFDTTIAVVKKNVDICLYKVSKTRFNGGSIAKEIFPAIMYGELKGGIDPAGADEHWKTGNTALTRIRTAFSERGYSVKTSFVGAAIEKEMAKEIFYQINSGILSYAANLTFDHQLTNYCEWLVKLK